MTNQLVLIDLHPADSAVWELDPATCEIGRRGVAQARRALQAARSATVPQPQLPAAA